MVGATLFATVATVLAFRYGITLLAWKGLLLAAVLLFASYTDTERREVDDFVHVMILIMAFIGFELTLLPSMLAGATAVLVPQLVIAKIRPNTIGGADIKLSAACTFLLGAERGMAALIIGLMLSLAVMPLYNKLYGNEINESYPLVPFLSAGVMAAYLI